MSKTVISDTSTLILFDKIGEFSLLKNVFNKLVTTPEVEEEFGRKLPDWIRIQSATDKKYQSVLETQLDYGEASTIALASDFDNVLLLIDDLKARKLAKRLQFRITGSLGIIHKAKQMQIIEKVKPLIDKLLSTDFRIADNIVEEILKINGE